jgi:hypothetical protein
LYSDTTDWQDPAHYYPSGQVANLYAEFMHQQAINSTPIFIDGKAYAIAYDDQGGQNPTLVLQNQSSVTATLGPWVTPTSPANDADFLAAVYQSVLNRALDAAGKTYWLGLLSAGTSRVEVSLDIVTSHEARTDVIAGFYTNLLHRSGDSQELNAFVNLFDTGWTQSQIKSLFYGSAEYFQVRGGGTNTGFINALYQDEFNRAPDSQSLAALTQFLASGQSRILAANIVTGSLEADQIQVNDYYLAYLHRAADAAGLAYWSNLFQQTHRDDLIQAGILGTQEFYERV